MKTGFLQKPAVDLTLILGVFLIACVMGGTASVSPLLFLSLLTVHTWLFGFDHVIATFTKLVGLPEDRRRYRFLIYGLPPLVFFATLAVSGAVGIGGLNTVYFFFQWFHTTRQSWGIAQHYRRAAGGLVWDPPLLSEVTLWALPIWGLLHRCHQQPEQFLYMNLYLPRVPAWLLGVCAVGTCGLLGYFVWSRIAAFLRGQLALGHTLYMGTHFVVFALSYLVVDDLHAGWLLVNVWHNVQYLVYVWMHNRDRFASGVRGDAFLLSWVCQPGPLRGLLYFGGCLLISTPLFSALFYLGDKLDPLLNGRVVSLSLLFALTLNFHHYLVDGIIWKRRRA